MQIKRLELPVKLILYSPYLPIVFIIFLLKPFLRVRVGQLWSSRIGHFSANTELYLCERDAKINIPNKHYIDLFFVSGQICNNYLLKMWKREIIILPSFILCPLHYYFQSFQFAKNFIVPEPSGLDRDIFNLFDKYDCHLHFTADEEMFGKKELERLGIKFPFVCLNIRDSAYLPEISNQYHSYRDCEINNYAFVVNKLTELGYCVIRMGAKVNSPLKTNSHNFIDYGFMKGFRTEFLDIYLAANCFFSISTSTGWDSLPYIFRKPIVYAPITPLGCFFTFSKKAIGIPKKYSINGKNLTIEEIFRYGYAYFLETKEYLNNNIILNEPSQIEIWEVVEEMIDLIKSNFLINPTFEQNQFYSILKKYPNKKNDFDYHGINYQGKIGRSYLQNI